MKSSILKFLLTYVLFVILFVVQKPIFMLMYNELYSEVSISDYIAVMVNGIPLDLSLAGYLSVIPGILLIIRQWSNSKILNSIEMGYYIIISFLMSIIFCLDLALYEYWGVRLDVTPLFYFLSSPSASMASISTTYAIIGIIAILVIATIYIFIFRLILLRIDINKVPRKRISTSVVLMLLTGALFIPIRGGFTVSTMNLSAVYFSPNQSLNHAAINPMFSFIYSATHQGNFSSQFRFFESEKANEIFTTLLDEPATDTIPQIINNNRPDIYLIILESFSSHLMKSLEGKYPIASNLDSIAQKSVLFTDFYANGYRTDRALPAILSAYPSQPTTSIMKDVTKTDRLPSIPRTLKENGYYMTYYYGGDANFTNLNAYLVSSRFDNIISDKDFPISERLSKWGTHDHLVFNRCIADVKNYQDSIPTFCVIQTSSSHEPFDVPYNNPEIKNKKANAFAYTDKCLGDFISQLKELGKWNNSLVIIVPDHYGAYPDELENPVERHRIPLIFSGGVISRPMNISTTASQIDIAATLLYQLNIPHEQFKFSKNILNQQSPHFAFFVDQSQFGFIEDDASVVYNCDAEKTIYENGDSIENILNKGKAFLQRLYDDLDQR